MVYAFKDKFLFGAENFDPGFGLCCAGSAEDQLSALAEMVGNGDTLHTINDSETGVPPLEYDLEDELARALNVEKQDQLPKPQPTDDPAMEFNDLDATEFGQSNNVNRSDIEATPHDVKSSNENDAFAEELSRLLETPDIAKSDGDKAKPLTDFSPDVGGSKNVGDYSDPAAEFQTFEAANSLPEVEQNPHVLEPVADPADDISAPVIDENSINAVLGASAALGAAARKEDASLPEVAQIGDLQFDAPESKDAIAADLLTRFDDHNQQDDQIIPSAETIAPQQPDRTGGKRVAIVILAIALLGGAGAMAWNYIDGPPQDVPVLLANEGAIKVKPKEAGGKIVPNQDQTVYKTVDGKAEVGASQKTLENKTEEPIDVANVGIGNQPNRIVAGEDANITEDILMPRSVRTVVVKPDGTILHSTQDKVDPVKLAAINTAKTVPVESKTINPSLEVAQSVSLPIKVTIAKIQPKVQKEQVRAPAAKKIKPVKVTALKAEPKKVKLKPIARKVPVKKAIPTPKPKKVVVAKAEILPSVSSPYAVQISSRRSADSAKAAWRKLSKRFASVLGGYKVDIRRSNIKDKGVYYRVRVPASSKANAQSLCSRLKSAGGDCLVTR